MKKIRVILDTKTQLDTFVRLCEQQEYQVFLTDGTHEYRVSAKSTLGCIMAKMEWSEIYCEYDEQYGDTLEHALHQSGLTNY